VSILVAGDVGLTALAYSHSLSIESDDYPFTMEAYPNLETNQLYYRRVVATDLSGNVDTGATMQFRLDTVFPTIEYTSTGTFYVGEDITVSASAFDLNLA